MSKNTQEFNPEEHRKKWLSRLARELEKTEKFFPAKILPSDGQYPKWVENIECELSLVMLPAVKLRKGDVEITPKRMGALLAHSCEKAVYMRDFLHNQTHETPDDSEHEPSASDVKAAADFQTSFDKWYSSMRRLAKLALCSSVDQSYEDMRDFLLGFADGFSRKPTTFKSGEMGNPTFEIYIFMIMYWQAVERLNSVRDLHDLLCGVFGSARIGDQKRIEKICQRIGLSFRKPGRPKSK
jgi:hypothetical protein